VSRVERGTGSVSYLDFQHTGARWAVESKEKVDVLVEAPDEDVRQRVQT